MLGHIHCHESIAGLKGLIFDCDGVLFDSRASNVLYYNAILEVMGLPPMDKEGEDYVHTHTVWQSLTFITPPERHDEIPEARAKVNYFTQVLPHLVPEPGLFQLLAWLKSRGFQLAVSTNRTNTMDRVVSRFQLDRFFWPVMTAQNSMAKPHPEPVHTILSKWGARPEEVAYIGDSAVDQATAEAGGVSFWAYKNPGLNAWLHVKDFWTLRLIIQAALDGCSNGYSSGRALGGQGRFGLYHAWRRKQRAR